MQLELLSYTYSIRPLLSQLRLMRLILQAPTAVLDLIEIARNDFGAGNYVEGWMRDPTIVGVWIDPTAPEYQKKAARVVARRNHLLVRELDANESLGE